MRRSFTLIEILIVVLILGILSTVSLIHLNRVIERSRWLEARMILNELRLGQKKLEISGLPLCEAEYDPTVQGFKCINVYFTESKYFDYRLWRTRFVAEAKRKSGPLVNRVMYIDIDGNLDYTGDTPDWVKY
jgi:prepilin-type N-terminal cleavage/methylation domain-containing protein